MYKILFPTTKEEYRDTVTQESWEEARKEYILMCSMPEVYRRIGSTVLIDTEVKGRAEFGGWYSNY